MPWPLPIKRLRVALLERDHATEPGGWWDGEPFDAIVLDAPCSATGILRSKPEVKHHQDEASVAGLVEVQARMLPAALGAGHVPPLARCIRSAAPLASPALTAPTVPTAHLAGPSTPTVC